MNIETLQVYDLILIRYPTWRDFQLYVDGVDDLDGSTQHLQQPTDHNDVDREGPGDTDSEVCDASNTQQSSIAIAEKGIANIEICAAAELPGVTVKRLGGYVHKKINKHAARRAQPTFGVVLERDERRRTTPREIDLTGIGK